MKPRKPRRVVPQPGPSIFQVVNAGPALTTWEERNAWIRAKQPRGKAVIDPEPDGPPADEVSEPLPTSDVLPTEEEIAKLPRWARVAFAARCARRAIPAFKKKSTTASPKHDNVIENATRLAEHAAATGIATDDVTYAPILAASVDAVYAAATVNAFAAAHAVNSDNCVVYATYAAARAFEIGVPASSIIRDYQTLLDIARLKSWTDETPVPPSVFGPLWPDGPPPGWPEDENADREIVLEIDLPDDATDDDVKRYTQLLVSKADDVYRAGGGNGLKISGLDVTGEKFVEKPSPDSTQPSESELVGGAT